MIHDEAPYPGSLDALFENTRRIDIVTLGIVPMILLLGFTLPAATQRNLIFDYQAPTILTAYSNHFMHISLVHLLVNLLGYGLIVAVTYALAMAANRRMQFFTVYLVFHLSIPFALSGMGLIWGWTGFRIGYSGILMAFLGYLPIVLLEFVGTQFGLPVNQSRSSWLFLLIVAMAAFLALPPFFAIPVVVAALLYFLVFNLYIWRHFDFGLLSDFSKRLSVPGNIELVIIGGIVAFFYPFIAFSNNLVGAMGTLNVYTHGLGLCLGYLIARSSILLRLI